MLCEACERLAKATSACGSGSRVARRVSAQSSSSHVLCFDRDFRLDGFVRTDRGEELIERRRVDDAEHRLAIDDEPDVDRELRAALDEGARPVERIDEEERVPASPARVPPPPLPRRSPECPARRGAAPSVNTSSASWSAMVTGVVSAFVSTSTPAAKCAISMRPAASTAGSNASTSGPYSSSFMCRSYPDSLAGLRAGRPQLGSQRSSLRKREKRTAGQTFASDVRRVYQKARTLRKRPLFAPFEHPSVAGTLLAALSFGSATS